MYDSVAEAIQIGEMATLPVQISHEIPAPPIWGQEACQIGSAYALQKGDWIFPAFREIAATLMMGVSLKDFYLYWMGNEIGSRAPEGINVMPVSVNRNRAKIHTTP
jgi:pyruvate dehydrogenase E1 component alpha subunit